MGMRFVAPIPVLSYTWNEGAQTVIQLNAPSDAVVIIHELYFQSTRFTADGHEKFRLNRVSTQGVGTALTEVRCETGFALPGSDLEYDHSTQATISETIVELTFQQGWHFLPVPAARIVISPGGRIALSTPGNLRFAIVASGYIKWEELGG